MSFEKILVPYDASSYANHAYDEALKIAEKFGSSITVLTVLGRKFDQGEVASLERAIEIHDEAEDAATEMLQDLQGLAEEKGVGFSFKVVHNPSAADGVVNFANSSDADLVVMGSHGRSGIKKAILGSVASKVVENADCAVLIIKKVP